MPHPEGLMLHLRFRWRNLRSLRPSASISTLVGACCLAWAVPANAEEEREAAAPVASSLSLKACVILALEQTFDLKIQRVNKEIAAARVGVARADYEPALTATLDYRDTTDPGGTDVQTGDFLSSETQTIRGDTGITGLLPSGGRYTLGASATDTDGERGPEPFSNGAIQGPFLEMRQPLLENFRIDDTRLNIRVSLQNLQISSLELKQAMLETVNRVEEAYYGLIAAEESVRVQEMALSLAEELWRENQKRVEHGDMAPIEAAEAQSQASTTKAALLVAQRQLRAQQNILKGAMVSDFARWRSVVIAPAGELTREPISFDYRHSWSRAMRSRPDLRTFQIQFEQQQLIEDRRKNALLPELDLTASVGLAGSDREVSGAFEQVRDRDAPYFSLGFSLALPLGNRRDKENHRIAIAETKQAELRLRQFKQSVMIEIDDAVSQAQTDYLRIAATREAREYAELALANEQAKLNRGASTNFVVLQLQRNLTSARSDEIQSLSDYSRSLSRLEAGRGIGPGCASSRTDRGVILTLMAKRSRKRPIIILVLLAGLAAGGWFGWKKYKGREVPIKVEVEEVTKRDVTESVVATGNIQPVTKVVINPEVAGEIVELPVKEGQRVKEGELLVKIRPDNYVASRNLAAASHSSSLANLKLSEANLEKANADFTRIEAMHKDKLISDAEFLAGRNAFQVAAASYESAQHGVEQAKAALDQADEDLAKTTIVAPIDGTITQLRSEKGERVVGTSLMAGTEIMTVAQLETMEARVEVGEIDVVSIEIGQKARLEADAFREDEFTGEVTEIANASNNSSATATGGQSQQSATKFQVKIRVNEEEAFRPGMSVTAYIETRFVSDVLTVPLQSVTTRAKEDKEKGEDDDKDDWEEEGSSEQKGRKKKKAQEVVFVIEGDRAKMVPVERGISDDDYVEIKSGVEEGQKVVSGSYRAINRDLKAEALVELEGDDNEE